jgi:hypothetical protein
MIKDLGIMKPASRSYVYCLYSLFNKIRGKGKIVSAGYGGGGRGREWSGW